SAALPEKVALDAAGFFVGRAGHKRPLGEVWRIGMRHVATDKDYEAIIMDGFHSSGPFPSCMTLGRHESEFHDRRRCPGATQALKTPAFIETGEFQTPFLGKAASALIRRSSLLVERLL